MNLNCLTETLIQVAPEPLGRKFEPGDGFAARQGGDWIPWEQTSVTHKGRDAWEFVQNSAGGLRAVSWLRLDPDLQVAIYQTTLTNTLDAPCRVVSPVPEARGNREPPYPQLRRSGQFQRVDPRRQGIPARVLPDPVGQSVRSYPSGVLQWRVLRTCDRIFHPEPDGA